MPRIKDQAICIRLIDWSETSQIVTLLCQDHGKLSGLAKGSKRTSPSSIARYSGGIELLTMGQVVAVIKPNVELATLTEWDLQESYWHLRENLRTQQLSFYAADLARAFLADHDPHPNSFAAMADLLADLAHGKNHEDAILWYQWRLLSDCGFRPQLDHDVRTGKPLPESSDRVAAQTLSPGPGGEIPFYLFDPQAGGLTTESIGTENGCWRVRNSTVQLLRQMGRNDQMIEADHPSMSQTVERANQLLCVYARAILDRQLPTMRVILDPKR